jgi:hypothetical protein
MSLVSEGKLSFLSLPSLIVQYSQIQDLGGSFTPPISECYPSQVLPSSSILLHHPQFHILLPSQAIIHEVSLNLCQVHQSDTTDSSQRFVSACGLKKNPLEKSSRIFTK